MKGIKLKGRNCSRLNPIAKDVSKQLLLVYEKLMICYSLSIFVINGIKDLLFISKRVEIFEFKRLVFAGEKLDGKFGYKEQPLSITDRNLLKTNSFADIIKKRIGLMVSYPKEISHKKGFINFAQLNKLAIEHSNNLLW